MEDSGVIKRSCKEGAAHKYSVGRSVFESNLRTFDVPAHHSHVHVVEGWYNETLPPKGLKQVSFLRLDGDMYTSTRDALVALYPLVVPGAIIYVDDYGSFGGCALAVDEFLGAGGAAVTIDVEGHGRDEDLAPDIDLSLPGPETVLMDMTYRPLMTPFLTAGRGQGLTVVDGLAMLIGQARPSFRALFGIEPPDVDVRRIALQALEREA
jgi:hypothetical protein